MANTSATPEQTQSAASTNEGNSQEPHRSGWRLRPLSVCGTHAVGLHAGRDLQPCCDATRPRLAKRRGLRGKVD